MGSLPPLFFALVLSVVDGDTLHVRITLWLDQTVETSIRIAGIDTPEMHGACPRERKLAIEAKAALVRILPEKSVIMVRRIAPDKYFGRVVADIFTLTNLDIAGHLLRIGLAHSYDGKKKRGWC